MIESIPPLNPGRDRNVDQVLEYRRSIDIGQALVDNPIILEYLRFQHAELLHNISHMQPATETDRDVAFAFNTVNAKINMIEKLYAFAVNLPTRVAQYDEFIRNTQPSQE